MALGTFGAANDVILSSPFYIQFGCGHEAPATWRNFDASPTLILERLPLLGSFCHKNAARFPDNVERGDIVKGLAVPPEAAEAVYCSHTLEHLALDEFRTALRNTFTMLRPGGIFRFVLPDLEQLARTYLANPEPMAAHRFMADSMLGWGTRPRGLAAFLKRWLGGSEHLWMWDYKAIEYELAAAGYVAIRRATFGDSADLRFSEVERPDRWADCLGVECRRPTRDI